MSVLAVVQANLIESRRKPATMHTGGTSKGDLHAGYGDDTTVKYEVITAASTAAAGLLSTLAIVATVVGARWIMDEDYGDEEIEKSDVFIDDRRDSMHELEKEQLPEGRESCLGCAVIVTQPLIRAPAV
jgi:hypothetical protein